MISLLSLYAAGRAALPPHLRELTHIGQAIIEGEWRQYLFLHPPAAISFDIPGEKLRFSFGLALHPDVWDQPDFSGCQFFVHVDDHLLFHMVLEPHRLPEHRRWQDTTLDLPADPRPQRRLRLSTQGLCNTNYCWALWSRPILEFPHEIAENTQSSEVDHDGAAESSITWPILFPSETRFFFIVGCMRSGTTWLMDTLNLHPDICCRGEMHVVETLDLITGSFPTLDSIANNLDKLHNWYLMPNNAWNLPFRHINKINISKKISKDFVRFFFEWSIYNYLSANNIPIPPSIGDKSPSHTRFIAQKIYYYFSVYNPIIIHLIRDPRDVAVSRWFWECHQQSDNLYHKIHFKKAEYQEARNSLLENPEKYIQENKKLFLYPEFLFDIFSEWGEVNISLTTQGPAFFGDNYLLIRYEDLKKNYKETITKIFQLLNLDVSYSLLESFEKKTDYSKMKQKPVTYRKGLIGEWQKYFTPEDINLFEEMVLPFSKKFGYF